MNRARHFLSLVLFFCTISWYSRTSNCSPTEEEETVQAIFDKVISGGFYKKPTFKDLFLGRTQSMHVSLAKAAFNDHISYLEQYMALKALGSWVQNAIHETTFLKRKMKFYNCGFTYWVFANWYKRPFKEQL